MPGVRAVHAASGQQQEKGPDNDFHVLGIPQPTRQ
jgi:hypothetical protein